MSKEKTLKEIQDIHNNLDVCLDQFYENLSKLEIKKPYTSHEEDKYVAKLEDEVTRLGMIIKHKVSMTKALIKEYQMEVVHER